MAAFTIISALAVCLTVSDAQPLTYSLSGSSSIFQPQQFTYYEPLKLFSPQRYLSGLDHSFPYIGTPLAPSFPEFNNLLPLNSTTARPDESKSEVSLPLDTFNTPSDAIEVTTPSFPITFPTFGSEDKNDSTILNFSDIFKKTVLDLPSISHYPQSPMFVPSAPVYPNIFQNDILAPAPAYNNYQPMSWADSFSINKAYGLPGFRPFHYEDYMRQFNSTLCSDNTTRSPFQPCDNELTPPIKTTIKQTTAESNNGGLLDLINRLYRPDPNIVIFNTKEIPPQRVEDEESNFNIDPRLGSDKNLSKKHMTEEPFFAAYKDLMFLNKTFLSTIAPYLHK